MSDPTDPHAVVERLQSIYRSELFEPPTPAELARTNAALDVVLDFSEALLEAGYKHERRLLIRHMLFTGWGIVGWILYTLHTVGVL